MTSASASLASPTKSELEYRRIVDLSPEAIAIHTMGKLVYINDEGAKLIGAKTPSEVIGRDIMQFVHPDFIEIVKRRVKYIYEKHKPTDTIEEKFVRLDGRNIDVEVVSMPLIFQGRASVQLVIRDITKRKELEERQVFLDKVSEELYTSFDENISIHQVAKLIVPYLADYCRVAILGNNKEIKEITVNHTDPTKVLLAVDLYESYKDNPLHTHGIPKIIQSGKAEIIAKIDQSVYDSIKESPTLIKILKDLELKSYVGVPLIAHKKIIGAISFSSSRPGRFYTKDDLRFFQEVGRRLAIVLDNAKLYDDAQKAIMLRDDFISVASHELKTPVTSLKAFTQVLQNRFRKKQDMESVGYLAKMDAQINKLTVLIQDLLDVTKIEGGKMQFNNRPFDFDELTAEIVEEIQRTTERHTITIKGKSHKTVTADRERIGQVFTNFLTNAIKYSPYSKKILVKVSGNSSEVTLGVQDFGVGISKAKQPHVFERFFRVTGEKQETYPGLGLGLYIASEIIKRQGGTIWLESQQGKGSTFFFKLPIRADKTTKQQQNTIVEEELKHE